MVFHSCQFKIGGAQIRLGRHDFKPLEGGVFDFIEQAAFAEQHAISAGAFGLFQTEAARGVGLRVEIEKEHAPAKSGEAGGEINGGGSFPNAAFLIGDRDDFGWHLPDLMKSAAGFQVRKRKTSLKNCAGLSCPAVNSSPAARPVKFDRKKKGLTGN